MRLNEDMDLHWKLELREVYRDILRVRIVYFFLAAGFGFLFALNVPNLLHTSGHRPLECYIYPFWAAVSLYAGIRVREEPLLWTRVMIATALLGIALSWAIAHSWAEFLSGVFNLGTLCHLGFLTWSFQVAKQTEMVSCENPKLWNAMLTGREQYVFAELESTAQSAVEPAAEPIEEVGA